MEGVLPALPWTVARASLKVPYLATRTFQHAGISFYDFPQYNGFPHTDDADGLDGKTIGSLTYFLQSWLFFELLSAFLERPINRDDFAADGFIEINQKSVYNHFRAWRAELSKCSYTRKRQAQKNIGELIKIALWKSDIFEEAADRFESRDEDFDSVALSIKLLISLLHSISDDTFSTMGSRLYGYYLDSWMPYVSDIMMSYFSNILRGEIHSADDQPLQQMGKEEARRYLAREPKVFVPLPPGDDRGGRAGQLLLRLFVENGWCPYRARQLCRSYDYLVVNSLASLKRHAASRENHGRCIQLERCCAHDLIVDSPGLYPFQHVDDDNCKLVDIPREEIADIIKSGGIPLISMGLDENDLDLKVVRCTPHITYTAISHVWSDGLGNPTSNALPLCQLSRLRTMISHTYLPQFSPFYDDRTFLSRYSSRVSWENWKLSRPGKPYVASGQTRVYFWMDTLCIPVFGGSQAAEERDLKFRAMKHITPIYAGAFNTLVLDRGLQDTSGPAANQVSGDEFAALVLGSKWMQRGWTLDEGSLAQTCVFQLMGKPYEMSNSLKNLLPQVKWHQSPLDRAFIKARRLMPLLINRGLLDEKRMLTTDARHSRASRLTKLLRVPQFVRAWNSLLERSTTKPEDGPIIFANLLDFNVHSLMSVPQDERLKVLIQNCDELPLSLLYNTGPRICIREHPELGWIPKVVAGNHLVVGAVIRRINRKRPDNQVTFEIDRSDSDQESVLVLRTLPGRCIPYEIGLFVVSDNTNQEYFIEIQRPAIQGPDDEEIQRAAREIYTQSTGTCIVIDLACGTASRRGFAGRGARFYVDTCNKREMTLEYDAALIAWTAEQWRHRFNCPQTASPYFDTEHVALRQRLLLNYSTSKIPHYHPVVFKTRREYKEH